MKKILLCFLLALTMVLSAVPMLAMTASADEGAPAGDGGASATVLTPDDLYVPGATVFLSAFKGENNITVNDEGQLLWTDAKTGLSYPIVGGSANIVGTYTFNHYNSSDLVEALKTQKVHYAADGTTELYRVTNTIYTDPSLSVNNDTKSYIITNSKGAEVIACRSEIVIEAKDANGNWSSDPELASYMMGGWNAGENGGIGYELPDFYYGTGTKIPAHYIDLGNGALPSGELTFEIVTSIKGATDTDNFSATTQKTTIYEGDGNWTPSFRVGPLYIVPRVTSPKSTDDCEPGIGKVYLSYTGDGSYSTNSNRFLNNDKRMAGITQGSTITVVKEQAEDAQYTYSILMRNNVIRSMTTGSIAYVPNSELTGDTFVIAKNLPETIFAVRVYATALTEEQRAQNHFADLAKYFELDLTGFSAVKENLRQLVYNNFVSFDFSADAEELQALLDETVEAVTYVPTLNQYDQLYVQKGLTVLLTAYDHSEKVVSLVEGNEYWQNKIADKNGEYQKFSIIGESKAFAFTDANGVLHEGNTAWRRLEGAGIGFEATLSQLQGTVNNYIDLGIDALPKEKYTVEMIFDAYGAYLDGNQSYRNGVAERWSDIAIVGNFDVHSKHLVEQESSLTEAPLDAFYFGVADDGKWYGTNFNTAGAYSGLNLDTLGVLNYTFYRENLEHNQMNIGANLYSNNKIILESGGKQQQKASLGDTFRLLKGTPGTVYAIRVYDRMLTENERIQNYFADICSFYKLDLTDFHNTVVLPEDARQDVYNAMFGFGFTSTREKAQEALTSAIYSALINFNGFAIKTQGNGEELSAIFTVNNLKINAILEMGYTVTYGTILADGSIPFDEILYDSTADGIRVYYLFSNDDDITTTPVYINQSEAASQFGASVFYDTYTTPENYGKTYSFRSFIILEKDGSSMTAYIDAKTDSLGTAVSHFSVAQHLTAYEKYHENNKLLESMDKSFNIYDVYVDVESGNDANDGSKNAPVKTLEKALELALEIINSMAMPEVNVNIAGGKYELGNTLTIDENDILVDYYRLNFKGYEAESPTITGTFEVPGYKFQLYDAEKNIYIYSLPESMKDANGKFPLFNNLYVDGKMATLAESEWFAMRHDEYKTDDGYFTVWVPEELLTGLVEKDSSGKYFLSGNYSDSMRWSVIMQWYYFDLIIECIDIETTNNVKEIPILVEQSNGSFAPPKNPTMRSTEGYVALKFYGEHGSLFNRNHASPDNLTGRQGIDYMAKLSGNMEFLDQGGEFYYDQEGGYFYYIPTEGQNVSDVTFDIPTLETLINLNGVHNVTFDGILFTGTDTKYIPVYGFTGGQAGSQKVYVDGNNFIHEGALIGQNVSNITVRNCTFTDIYYLGINFYGITKNVKIDSNVFTNLGAGAIQLGASAVSQTDNHTNVRITNNYVNEVAIRYYNNCAITVLSVKHGKILQNSIIDCAYTGISVGWSWLQTTAPVGTYFNVYDCEIAYNYLENFMFLTYDGGSIYTLGGNAPVDYHEYLNELHHNYSYCGSRSGHITAPYTSTALYHDGGSSHWYTHDNVTWVEQETIGHYNYISIQAGAAGGSQAYNILAENNYFINLYQKYMTLGYRRVREDWNVYEVDSYLLTTLDPSEFKDTYISVNVTHTVSKNPANWAPFYQSGRVEAMDDIMSFAGCDLFDGIYKGAPLGDLAYDYNYRLLTQSETWYTPERDNPNYPDR